MPIEFQCASCQKLLRVPDSAAGKKARCPTCGTIHEVPATVEPGAPVVVVPPVPPIPQAPDYPAGSHSHPFRERQPFSDRASPFATYDRGSDPFGDSSVAHPATEAESNPYASPSSAGGAIPAVPQFGPAAQITAESRVRGPALAMLIVSTLTLGMYLITMSAQFVAGARMRGGVPHWVFIQHVIPLGIHAIIVFGAWDMLHLRRFGMALAASVLSMLPCGMCCLVTLPVGIWSLVVLNDPVVKQGFAHAASTRAS
jgi:hypothetical protein